MVKQGFSLSKAFGKLEKDFNNYTSTKKRKKVINKIKSSDQFSGNVVKRDFDAFQFGIQRLKELGNELNSLDTRGFSKEASSIRAKLKNVSEIPIIEKELKGLKFKIDNKYKPKKKRNSVVKAEIRSVKRELKKLSNRKPRVNEELKKDVEEMKGSVNKLSNKIEKLSNRKPRTNNCVKEEVEGMMGSMDELKEELEKLSHRRPPTNDVVKKELKEIKEEIEEVPEIKRNIGKMMEDLDEVPEMKDDIENLGKKIEEIGRRKKFVIDSDVDILVDSNFDDFLVDVKSALSNRIKRKEKQINDILRVDLQNREQRFKQKYLALIEDFNDKKRELIKRLNKKYELDLNINLENEVARRFNFKVQETVKKEREVLEEKYAIQLREQLKKQVDREKIQIKNKLSSGFEHAIKQQEIEFEKTLKEQKIAFEKTLKEQEMGFEKKFKEQEIEFEKTLKQHKEELSNEYHRKLKEQVQLRMDKEIDSIKEKFAKDFDLKLKKEIKSYEEQVQERMRNALNGVN